MNYNLQTENLQPYYHQQAQRFQSEKNIHIPKLPIQVLSFTDQILSISLANNDVIKIFTYHTLYHQLQLKQMEQLLVTIQAQYYKATERAYTQLLQYWPRFDNYNHFDKFIILNLLIIGIFIIYSILAKFSPKGIYQRVMRFFFSLWFVRKEVATQIEHAKKQILSDIPKHLLPELDKIPYKVPDIVLGDLCEKQSLKGKLSGSRYALESHSKFVTNLAKTFSYSNPLHLEMFPLLKQMQNQVIDMTAQALNFKNQKGQSCGTTNSGGTQSIIMAILAYREYKIKEEGVKKPNMVICKTGHVAALKACDYLGIEVRLVGFDKNYEMDFSEMKRNIDSQTICVYTSYPNYPYGTCDPIHKIAPYCKGKKIPVHVDMCLGGFIAPFIEQNWKLPEGVTSISADPHKYGLSAKGISILLYSSEKYRKNQFFVTSYWPGGLYCTPGLSGSRTGVYIASAWISMMKLGVKGYKENARILRDTVLIIGEQLKKLDFEVFGKPNICILSFRHKKHSVSNIVNFMKKKGWGLAVLQNPLSIHFSFTPLNCTKRDEMIKDFKECIAHMEKNDGSLANEKQSGQIQLYGMCTKVPDSGTKNQILSAIIDTFLDLS